MVERYQQGQLASPVVGTPGVDQSAGKAEELIAQSGDRMRDATAAASMSQLREAEQNFNTASGRFFYTQQQQRAFAKAEEAEQRRLQVEFDLLDEGDRLNKQIDELKTAWANSPQLAVSEFQKQLPQMRLDFQQRHAEDPKRLRMMMPTARRAEIAAANELEAWARQTTTKNLERRLQLMPAELSQKIDNLEGPLSDQLFSFQRQLRATNGVYDSMRQRAVTQDAADNILTHQLEMSTKAANQVVDHFMAQVPDGEEGLKYLDTVDALVSNAHKNGLPLTSNDQREQIDKIRTQRSSLEQEVITGIRGETDLRVIDANRIKAELFNAANDPKTMHQLSVKVNTRLKELDHQVALVSKEPDGKIRNAKLAGLKQEQGSYIQELGLDLKLVRSFEQLQRTLTTFAQGQLKFQQGQMLLNRSLVEREIREDNKAATEALVQAKDAFNKNWAGVNLQLQSAWAEPAGPKQQEAISKIVNYAIPRLNQAVTSGAITTDQFKKYMDQLGSSTETASFSKTSKDWFGNEQTKVLTGAEKQKAQAKARTMFAEIVKGQEAKFFAIRSSVEQVGTLTTSKAEKVVLTQYVSANLPTFMENPKYKAMNPMQQSVARATWMKDKLTKLRLGELR